WGLPVVEAAAAGRLVAAGPYPVLREIRAAGLIVPGPDEVRRIAELLTGGAEVRAANRAVVRRRFDAQELPRELTAIATRARELSRG
ncbi:MAG: hypothetical protein IJH84_11830, partial [Saccharopolyspora sp.]|nr:hypothetical protein [Saccharopolyspora sp.]